MLVFHPEMELRLFICKSLFHRGYRAFQREHKEIETLFCLCRRISINSETGQQAGRYACRYRKAHQGISLEDYLLAASANLNLFPLWTSNSKHYPMDDIALFDLPG